MSSTSVYAIYKTKASHIDEYHNGHGSGPAIWDYISMKLTGQEFQMFGDDLDSFWKSWKDKRLSRNEKAVLLSTYDNAVIEIKYMEEFSKACIEVHNLINNGSKWTWNHFSDIGKTANKLAFKHDHRCIGFGIGCTSICDPWEFWDPKQGKPWGVYETIESIKELKR